MIEKRVPPLLSIGFRPFFLLAGLASVTLIFIWGGLLQHGIFPQNYYSPVNWHAHEMLFGYTVAVVAGFLLTSVKNWTGITTAEGYSLAGLALLWLLGRLVPFAEAILPVWLLALIDLAFLPCLTIYLAIPLWRERKARNYILIALLLSMFVANILFHLDTFGVTSIGVSHLYSLVVGAIMVLVAIIAGRVLPFFTQRGLPGAQPISWPWVDKISIGSLLALMLIKPFFVSSLAFMACSIIAIVANTIRLTGWYCKGVHKVGLLWVLFTGYAWLIVGLTLDFMAAFSIAPPQLALHAMTVGCIGVMTLGMMTRVSLGHTGREILANKVITASFLVINLAVFCRVIMPLIDPAGYMVWVVTSSGLWSLAFAIYIIYFMPVLFKKRADA